MNVITQHTPASILAITPATQKHDTESLLALHDSLWTGFSDYANGYGQEVMDHARRVANNVCGFLAKKGYDPEFIEIIRFAVLHHDDGKQEMKEYIWNSPEKPTEEIKALRLPHAALGAERIQRIAKEQFPHLVGTSAIEAMKCVALNHHERLNSRGPEGLEDEQLGEVLEVIGIFDELDGKTRPRLAAETRTIPEALREMSGLPAYTSKEKHKGDFRLSLLQEVAKHLCPNEAVFAVQRGQSLAFTHNS